jgi:P-type Cu2+ transporter
MTALRTFMPAASTETACFHCGAPVPADAGFYQVILGESRALCCPGCQAVAQLIVDGGMEDYYRYRQALPQQPEDLQKILAAADRFDIEPLAAEVVHQDGPVHSADLLLEGISCAACVWLIERQLARLPGMISASVNYATRRAEIRWQGAALRLGTILRALGRLGYAASPYDARQLEAARHRERKTALMRLFVAGLGMMQVMMYAVPVYLATDGTMTHGIEQLMRWAGLLLTLPVVLYSAAPFFRNAWREILARRLGMDVPVALGLGGAFAASVAATLSGHGTVYFDSITMFVFFLLCGRYLEQGARQKALTTLERLAARQPVLACRLTGYPASLTAETIPATQLKPGDQVLVQPGEAIPADGMILSGDSEADAAMLTGESRPLVKRAGDRVMAGGINIINPLVIQVEQAGEQTRSARILQLMQRALAEKPAMVLLADRMASYFVLAVLLLAAATGYYWLRHDAAQALWVTVSVLVITCPCALSLATPVALTAATGRLAAEGLLVTRAHAIETLARVTHVIFDKTGTLTLGRMQVINTVPLSGLDASACLALAARLEMTSGHPVARALVAAAGLLPPAAAPEQTKAVAGGGIEAVLDGRTLRVGSLPFVGALHGMPLPEATPLVADATPVALGDAHGWLALFFLQDELRPSARPLVEALRARGIEVRLLSGDTAAAASAVADQLGIAVAAGEMSPERKQETVARLQGQGAVVAMVGDGLNDAPVLAQAQVSIAMNEGAALARANADMVFLEGDLMRLAKGEALARKAMRIIRQNLGWALAYNAVSLPLAMAGFITPWMAGIGMSASSLLVVLNALRLARPTEKRNDHGNPLPADPA